MNSKSIEKLIKESFKDLAIRLYDLNYKDRQSLLSEYKEWFLDDLNFDQVMMLPYEAYTDNIDNEFLEDLK